LKTIQIIGYCGSGKTWVTRQLLDSKRKVIKVGLLYLNINKNCIIPGVYTKDTFSGSDKLSMAVSKDFELMNYLCKKENKTLVVEGQRFMNKKFRDIFQPTIIKINDDGTNGINQRKSTQSERHLKSIKTAVDNIEYDILVKNSKECYEKVLELL